MRKLQRWVAFSALAMAAGLTAQAEDIQGLLSDWKCTERMVKDGRENTLKNDRGCSLVKNSARAAYGLITEDKKYYRLDAEGIRLAKMLLNNSHDKDNLRVIVKGDLQGNLIKVATMSIL
jgi:hypothetical protein